MYRLHSLLPRASDSVNFTGLSRIASPMPRRKPMSSVDSSLANLNIAKMMAMPTLLSLVMAQNQRAIRVMKPNMAPPTTAM